LHFDSGLIQLLVLHSSPLSTSPFTDQGWPSLDLQLCSPYPSLSTINANPLCIFNSIKEISLPS
jgi:hypothetical protein